MLTKGCAQHLRQVCKRPFQKAFKHDAYCVKKYGDIFSDNIVELIV